MHVRQTAVCLLVALLSGACAVTHTGRTARIALLAPFEGRYREVGYNALYAARLALREHDDPTIELLPIDDGGSIESAQNRAQALAGDPLTIGAIVLGYAATAPETQAAYGDLPVVIVGYWGDAPLHQTIFTLSHADVASMVTTDPRIDVTDAARLDAPFAGGDVLALEQFALLRGSLDGVTVVSSGSLPDDDFAARYQNNDPFAPEPGLLAVPTYNAVRIIAEAYARAQDATDAREAVSATLHTGGAFANGYHTDARLNRYRFNANDALVAVDHIVE